MSLVAEAIALIGLAQQLAELALRVSAAAPAVDRARLAESLTDLRAKIRAAENVLKPRPPRK